MYCADHTSQRGHSLPPLWLLHGSADTIVPATGSIKFAQKYGEMQIPHFHFTICHGEEHLFDVDTGDDSGWAQDGLTFISEYWPAIC